MLKLSIPKMSCGHCASTIEKAVKSVDPGAQITIDLSKATVAISTSSSGKTISQAIKQAGYENAELTA